MKRKIEFSVAIGLIVSIVISIAGFGKKCNEIRNDVVRLHILANSDSDEDQNIKLVVRDALLECGYDLFSGIVTKENAEIMLEEEKEALTETANKILKENGFDYKSEVYLAEEYFTTRQYENFTLPAGKYLALKVILGNGAGHNWWCVMFPPLCLPAATEETSPEIVLGNEGADIIRNTDKYIVKFKIIELIESIKQSIKK